jgi:6,7-dimethyl-8-ribityllumazine synthase
MNTKQVPHVLDGEFQVPNDARFAIVASRFNHFVVDRLIEGALDGLSRHGVEADRVLLTKVPGAFEIPLVCRRLAESRTFSAVIALGAVIRGATYHFEVVARQAAEGCARAMMDTGVPVCFGVLTVDTIEQAIERAGTKAGNHGFSAALCALEMVSVGSQLTKLGL